MRHAPAQPTGARPLFPSVDVRLSLVLLLLTMAVSSCAPPPSAEEPGQLATLNIGFGGPSGQGEFVTVMTTDGLIRNTPEGRYEARLAASYVIEEEGRVLTLQLRQGVSFHDGSPLDGAAVKRFLDEARRDERQLQFPLLTDIADIEVMAPQTVRLYLERPSAWMLLGDLALGVYKEVGGRRIGTGPFVLESESQDAMTFVSNPDYHLGWPTVDVVQTVWHSTVRTAWAALMRGELDYLYDVPVSAREFVEAESNFDLVTVDRPYTYLVGFNHQHAALAKTQVRQALNYAIDRRVLVDRGYGGVGSGVWPTHWVYDGVERTYPYDPVLADRLLDEAGYAQPPPGGGEDAMASRLRFTSLIMEGAIPEGIALLVQRQLYEVGVDMQLEAVAPRDLLPRMANGDYDAVMVQMNLGRTLARLHYFWHSSSSEPQVAFGYTATDDVLDDLRDAPTPDDMSRAASAFQ